MADIRVREQVRDDMRDSPITQHKLILQDYLLSMDGTTLLHGMAERLGVGVDAVLDSVASTPELDFYLALRQQRLAWTPSSPFVVAGFESSDHETLRAFNSQGQEVPPAARTQATGLFVVGPGEPKGRRFVMSDESGLETIQKRWIEPRFLTVVVRDSSGSIVDEYSVLVGLPEDGPPVGEHQTYVFGNEDGNSYIHDIIPFEGDGVGDCELHYYGFFAVSTVVINQHDTTDPDVPCPDQTTTYPGLGKLLIDAFPDTATHRLSLKVYEEDQFNDDYWGKTWWDWDEFGEQKNSDQGDYAAEVHWVF